MIRRVLPLLLAGSLLGGRPLLGSTPDLSTSPDPAALASVCRTHPESLKVRNGHASGDGKRSALCQLLGLHRGTGLG